MSVPPADTERLEAQLLEAWGQVEDLRRVISERTATVAQYGKEIDRLHHILAKGEREREQLAALLAARDDLIRLLRGQLHDARRGAA